MNSRKKIACMLSLILIVLTAGTINTYSAQSNQERQVTLFEAIENTPKGYAKVKTYLNVRKEPNTTSEILGTIQPGQITQVVNGVEDFYEVLAINDSNVLTTAYIKKDYLAVPRNAKYLKAAGVFNIEEESLQNENSNLEKICKKLDNTILREDEQFSWLDDINYTDKEASQVCMALDECIYDLNIDSEEIYFVDNDTTKNIEVKKGTDKKDRKDFSFINTTYNTLKFKAFVEDEQIVVLAFIVR